MGFLIPGSDRVKAMMAQEKERFQATKRAIVAVKRAPWSDEPDAYGEVYREDFAQEGSSVTVYIAGTPPKVKYPSLDAMLEHWIGD